VIKAIVVDDEAPARREMRRVLSAHESITVVGEARDLPTARGLLLRTRPDVVFLDVRLGKASGFDLLGDVDEETAVVFVTAYDEHAIRAFEANALDYLVKPVEPARLARTVARLEARAAAEDPNRTPEPFTPLRWVFLEAGDTSEFLELAVITHVTAESGGSRVHTRDGRSICATKSLKRWEERLPGDDFLRVHRSAIVNLRHLERVVPWSNYSYRVHLRGWKEPVTMSRRYAREVRRRLG
jgi:two-component system LytT family response regulator